MAEQGNTPSLREYRKGNWTVHETMILITAKKKDEERRMKRSSGGGGGESTTHDHQPRNKPAELRWKWVEDFCWSNGCLRSQNQCNDKWDNLMREYKKVRDYENSSREDAGGSYWKLERHERKDRNLPTNMLLEIYEALVEVVEKRSGQRFGSGGVGVGGGSSSIMDYVLQNTPMSSNATLQPSLPPLLQLHSSDPTPTPTPPLSALQLPPPPPPCHSFPSLGRLTYILYLWFASLFFISLIPFLFFCSLEMYDSSDSDTSENPDSSPAKRRKKSQTQGRDEDTNTSSDDQQVGSAISRSASMIAEAIQSCEEQEERRHREYLSLQERKLKIEELRNETDREAIGGLVHAINNLANSIFGLASDKTSRPSK